MKYNMELVREILFCIEKGTSLETLQNQYGQRSVLEHVALLKDAEMIEAKIVPNAAGVPVAAANIALTWAGQEFVAKVRDNAGWKRVLRFMGREIKDVSRLLLLECLKKQLIQ